jgi:hypothetical protein
MIKVKYMSKMTHFMAQVIDLLHIGMKEDLRIVTRFSEDISAIQIINTNIASTFMRNFMLCMDCMRNAYKILVRKLEWRMSLWRFRWAWMIILKRKRERECVCVWGGG